MNNKNISILAVVVLITVLIAGFLLFGPGSNKQSDENQTAKTAQNKENVEQIKQLYQENITLTASGFDPQTATIKSGTRIVWLNKSGTTGTVNSDNYPTNLLFPFLNLGRFPDKSSVSVMFTNPGKYTYHNALNPDQKGIIIVE